jgi:hypothetical protein
MSGAGFVVSVSFEQVSHEQAAEKEFQKQAKLYGRVS